MKRNLFLVPAAATLVLGAVASPSVASASPSEPRDPAAPGCSVTTFVAETPKSRAYWTVECVEERTVVVDVTAFSGTPDDHAVVEEHRVSERVAAGGRWTSFVKFSAEGIDQVRGQAVTFVSPDDPTERPAIIGGATG